MPPDIVSRENLLNKLFAAGDESPATKIERGLRSRAAQRRAAA
jgi:hypothetical protein